jgi:hypothetical protein
VGEDVNIFIAAPHIYFVQQPDDWAADFDRLSRLHE